MPLNRKLLLASPLLVSLGSASHGVAQEGAAPSSGSVVHELKLVASNEKVITRKRAPQLIALLNNLIRNAAPGCANVTFALSSLTYDERLLAKGDDSTLVTNVKTYYPDANVFVVNGNIGNCRSISASGCTDIGKGPMIVVDEDKSGGGRRAPVAWVHERGHAMGLEHADQDVDSGGATAAQQVAIKRNIMGQWAYASADKLDNVPGVGKFQCKAYQDTSKNGVVAHPGAAAQMTDAMEHLEGQMAQSLLTTDTPLPIGSGPPSSLTTPAADLFFGKDAPGWDHGPPLTAFSQLTDKDVESIAATILSTKPLPEWADMLTVIAYRAHPQFRNVVNYVLNQSPPNIPSVSDSMTAEEEELRDDILEEAGALDRAKGNIPYAVGIYGCKTDDQWVEELLKSLMDPKVVAGLFGEEYRQDIESKAAPSSLGLAIGCRNDGNKNDIGATAQMTIKPEDSVHGDLFSEDNFSFRTEVARNKVSNLPPATLTIDSSQAAIIKESKSQAMKLGLDDFLTKER